MALNVDVKLKRAQVGDGITEFRPGQGQGIHVTVGRPLLSGATELLERGEPSSAVAAAHTASQVYVRHILDLWAAVRGQEVPERVRSYAFYKGNETLVSAYEELSGDHAVRRAAFWTSGRLSKSNKRRNRIVHAGYVCSEDEARDTIHTLNELHRYLDGRLRRAGIRTSND
jgi:hypothetical protein